MKHFFLICLLAAGSASAQELYVYTDPASNVPAKSLSIKAGGNFIAPQLPYDRFMQRHTLEINAGLSKSIMLRAGATFANMHTDNYRWESVYLYGKYRFLSKDELHSHFRMAVFAEGGYTRSPFHFDETYIQGDKNGIQVGVIATQLWNKLAVSATMSHLQVLDSSRKDSRITYVPGRIYQAMNYSLSAGYLLLPVEYTDYKQTNLNLYAELLAQQSLDRRAYYVDLAPAVQLIFNSNTKVNLGYRFQLGSDMERMSRNSWMISVERTLLNAL